MTAATPPAPPAASAVQLRSRLQLILLAILFIAPFSAAYVAFYLVPQWTPQHRLNYGTLINPVRPMPVVALRDENGKPLTEDLLRGKWTLLQIVRGNRCVDECLREAILTRQTRAVMGRDDRRVRRLMLAAPGADLAAIKASFGKEQPDLHYAQEALAEPFALPVFASAPDNAILILDPLGNWLMMYPPYVGEPGLEKDFKGIQKDLKNLLKLSHIG